LLFPKNPIGGRYAIHDSTISSWNDRFAAMSGRSSIAAFEPPFRHPSVERPTVISRPVQIADGMSSINCSRGGPTLTLGKSPLTSAEPKTLDGVRTFDVRQSDR
jgi:hypothetical protein